MKSVIAVDLGASSGRVMHAQFDGERFILNEVHRFPSIHVSANNTLYWDALYMWHEIQTGLRQISDAASIGVDTWGVDFGLLDKAGNLLGNPVHYRDNRTEGMMEWVFDRVPRRDVFERTGIQFMPINTLYQFASLKANNSPLLEVADTLITIPNLFLYWLTGMRHAEFSFATTTQMYNPRIGDWDRETLTALDIPTHILPPIVQPGTHIGEYNGIPVIAPACHDTACAVVAVPTTTANYAYLSSGTWSLLGLEVDTPVINDASYQANITNEGGATGNFRLLKNVMGLWLEQQCLETWRQQGTEYSFVELKRLAMEAEPFAALIDPNDPMFLAPGDMPSRIADFCQRTDQPVPEEHGQLIRVIYESLALKYRHALDGLIDLTGQQVDRLHIIGGGSQNELLCQMTADATGRTVVTGPVEATALGNAIVQYVSLGVLEDIAHARQILSRTLDTKTYVPQSNWDEQYQRFNAILAS